MTTVVRGEAALTRRRAGIDYDAVPVGLVAIEPGDPAYADVRSTYMRGGSPAIVLQPTDVEQVRKALAFARGHPDAVLALRSRGHGFSGRSTNDGGIVIDLHRLDAIDVIDADRRIVRIGPGASWSQVAAALDPHGWAISSGDYGGVGVGGLATAGGVGWLVREHGLTIDHVVAVELVLADGELVRVDADHDPELFWAVRGAGSALGIATAFEIVADPVGDIGFAELTFDGTDLAGFLERFGSAVEDAPRSLTASLMSGARRLGGRHGVRVAAMVDSADPDEIISVLQPLADIAPLLDHHVRLRRYRDVMAAPSGPQHGWGEPVSRSILVDHLSPQVSRDVATLLESGSARILSIRSAGGAVGDVSTQETAYAGRSANFSVVALGSDDASLDIAWAPVEQHASGSYLSFESQLGAHRLALAFPPATLERLQEVKRRVDPLNVFRDNIDLSRIDAAHA